jgi:hypothetical protein
LQTLQGWSLMAAATVAEIASAGEWYVRAGGIMGQFDQSDLMVLSYNDQQPKGITKDDLQIAYSDLLSTQGIISAPDGRNSREGWELAIQVLGRLDDGMAASERIERIINNLQLDSATRVDKITQLCHDMGLASQALSVALVCIMSLLTVILLIILELRRSPPRKHSKLWRHAPLLCSCSQCFQDPGSSPCACCTLPRQVDRLSGLGRT